MSLQDVGLCSSIVFLSLLTFVATTVVCGLDFRDIKMLFSVLARARACVCM
jgi:hypothetical protein